MDGNLDFGPGNVLFAGVANLSHGQNRSIISNIAKIDADYVLLDLGSGSHYMTLDFFLMANSGLLVTTPQAPAILNAYGFLKNAVFRHLQQTFSDHKGVTNLLTKILKEAQPNATPTISKILEGIARISHKAESTAREALSELRPTSP